jgi:hypothetical protein
MQRVADSPRTSPIRIESTVVNDNLALPDSLEAAVAQIGRREKQVRVINARQPPGRWYQVDGQGVAAGKAGT